MAQVKGMCVSTKKDDSLIGLRFLIVQRVDGNGRPLGEEEVAVDVLGAGKGEYVLVSKGSTARALLDRKDSPVDSAIVGIIDTMGSE